MEEVLGDGAGGEGGIGGGDNRGREGGGGGGGRRVWRTWRRLKGKEEEQEVGVNVEEADVVDMGVEGVEVEDEGGQEEVGTPPQQDLGRRRTRRQGRKPEQSCGPEDCRVSGVGGRSCQLVSAHNGPFVVRTCMCMSLD